MVVEPWPVITVSREFGARGEALAKLIGDYTGFFVWDGELVQAVAEETGANETVLRSLDEHRRHVLEDTIEGALMGGTYMKSEYMRRLLKLFHTIAAHGEAIIVGRGAEYALTPESALHVRVVSPLSERVRSYSERHGLDERRAKQTVTKGERERAVFIRHVFHRKAHQPQDYDLTVNTGTLGLERLADVVLTAYEAKFGRRPPLIQPVSGRTASSGDVPA